jgi:uncharacterized protein (TIGR02145 family)
MKNALVIFGIILILTNSCSNSDDCHETIDSISFYPVMKGSNSDRILWSQIDHLFSNISFMMELYKSGDDDFFCTKPYTTNEIDKNSIIIYCNKPLNSGGISIPAYTNIIEYFEIKKDIYWASNGWSDGYLFTLKSDYRSIFQDDTYTITVEAKSNKNELFKDSCIVTFYSKDTILFNPDLIYGSITDIDNNTYKTIIIGNQTWMAENLKTTKYNNGELIGTTIPSTMDISGSINPKYQWAVCGDENNVAIYGRLYTWHTIIDDRNICPTGWHIPSKAEWNTLINYLGGFPIAHKLKEVGYLHWRESTYSIAGTNETGFSALPTGKREVNGEFDFCYHAGPNWWSNSASTEGHAYAFWIDYEGSIPVTYISNVEKSAGASVRCIKD